MMNNEFSLLVLTIDDRYGRCSKQQMQTYVDSIYKSAKTDVNASI